jgi:hypothetical protein
VEKLSGLVLDVYDDPSGEVLRAIFPSYEQVPELIKSAHVVQPGERSELPDDLFALILVDGDVSLRKYACVDAGNTALSVEYFMQLRHKLPEEAQKVAASNLTTACGWYGIEPPEALLKVAGVLGWGAKHVAKKAVSDPLGTAMTAMTLPGQVKGIHQTAQARGAEAKASGAIINPNVLKAQPAPQ